MKWEYKTIKSKDAEAIPDNELNSAGTEGWELIAITEFSKGGFTWHYNYLFKRAKQ